MGSVGAAVRRWVFVAVVAGVAGGVTGCGCYGEPGGEPCNPTATPAASVTPAPAASVTPTPGVDPTPTVAAVPGRGADAVVRPNGLDSPADVMRFGHRALAPSSVARVRALQLDRELRRNAKLIVPAAAVVASWSGAVERLRSDPTAQIIVTRDMLSVLARFAETLESEAEDRGLARTAGRVARIIRSRAHVGMPVEAFIEVLLGFVELETGADDASLRFSDSDRGLAREGETVVVPATAHVSGALGTRWRTDLAVTAVGDIDASAVIALLPRDRENLDPEIVELEIEGGRSLMLEDVLDGLFDFSGAAALRVTCESGAVIVTSRTYNLEGSLGSPDARTFGQFLPALVAEDAVVDGDQGRLLMLAHDPSLDRSQRTNVILVNGGDRTIEVSVELYTSDGNSLGVVTRSLRAWEYKQLDRVFEEVTSDVVADGFAIVRVTTGGGRAFALASVVDNLTGDPVAVPAILRSPYEETSLLETQVIQATARIGGVANTDWRSDLVLHGLTGVVTTARVELLPRGQENTAPPQQLVQIPHGQSLRYDDVLESLFGTEGAASIRVTPIGGAVGISSRTYNLLGEGNSGGYPAGATFGQFLGPVGFTRSFTFGEEAWVPHLSHDPTLSKGSRANLGLVNNSPRQIDLEIDLHRGDGTLLGSFTQTLRQWENVQIAKVFERVTSEAVVGGYAVIRTSHPAGAFVAHGSVVDNRTGDPITVDAVAVRKPRPSGVVASGDMLMQAFEAGFTPSLLFGLLSEGNLSTYLDDIAASMPDRIVRTANGIVYDLGAGTAIGGTIFTSGRVGLEDASITDGSTVTGTVTIDLDGTAVDGRAPVVGGLELGLDLAQVGGDRVAGTVLLGSPQLAKSVTSFAGSLEFDTRICELYPIGGSITVTIDGEVRTLSFDDSCDGSFQVDVPSASFYSLTLAMHDCQGSPSAAPQVLYLIDEDGQLSVDPSSPPGVGSRRSFAAAGRVLPSEASVRFAQRAGAASAGERRVGGYQGMYQSSHGGPGYYTGSYGYTVTDGACRSSFYHGREDPDFVAGVLEACDGPCGTPSVHDGPGPGAAAARSSVLSGDGR